MLLERLPFFGTSAKSSALSADDQNIEILPATGSILLSVALPKLPPSQRRNAARYAVEDQLVEDVEIEQVCVGPEFPLGSGRWLVLVLPKGRVQQVAKSKRPVFSKLMNINIPDQGWLAVKQEKDVLLRNADGTGTVMPLAVFEAWATDKKASGIIKVADGETGLIANAAGTFDLRRNVGEDIAYMFERGLLWSLAPLLGCIVVLWGIETYETSRAETYRDNQILALTAQLDTLGASGNNPMAAASALIAEAASREESNAVLQSLLGAMAMVPFEALNISVRNILFQKADGALVLSLGGASLQDLQNVENLFEGSVANASLGPSELRDGVAVAELILTLRGQQ